MTTTTLIDFLSALNRPGSYQRATWTSEVRPAAAHKDRTLVKISTAVVRTRVEYSNLAVNDGVETGDLPWGSWHLYPYVVVHKGQYYARLFTVDGTVRTQHFVDGEPVERDMFIEYLTPSARNADRPRGGVVTIKVENVRLTSKEKVA